jgi:hypothetical protein
MAIPMALTIVDSGSRAESSEWAWGKGRDRTSDGKATGKRLQAQPNLKGISEEWCSRTPTCSSPSTLYPQVVGV